VPYGGPGLGLHCGQSLSATRQRLLSPERYEGRLVQRSPPDLVTAALPEVQHDGGSGNVLRVEKFFKLLHQVKVLVVQAFLYFFPDVLFNIRRFDVCDGFTCKFSMPHVLQYNDQCGISFKVNPAGSKDIVGQYLECRRSENL
jgi:hypothetical protein